MANNLLSERLVYTGKSPVKTHLHICIYDKDGAAAVPFDTFFAMTRKDEGKVTSHPTEPNGFFVYNKVFSREGIILCCTLYCNDRDIAAVSVLGIIFDDLIVASL